MLESKTYITDQHRVAVQNRKKDLLKTNSLSQITCYTDRVIYPKRYSVMVSAQTHTHNTHTQYTHKHTHTLSHTCTHLHIHMMLSLHNPNAFS